MISSGSHLVLGTAMRMLGYILLRLLPLLLPSLMMLFPLLILSPRWVHDVGVVVVMMDLVMKGMMVAPGETQRFVNRRNVVFSVFRMRDNVL